MFLVALTAIHAFFSRGSTSGISGLPLMLLPCYTCTIPAGYLAYFVKRIDLFKNFLKVSPDFHWNPVPNRNLPKLSIYRGLFDRAP